jgi:hypothetical protein
MSERPRVKQRQEEDDIETEDSTCRLQRQVDEPKYILDAYTSPKYQATNMRLKRLVLWRSNPTVHQKMSMKH